MLRLEVMTEVSMLAVKITDSLLWILSHQLATETMDFKVCLDSKATFLELLQVLSGCSFQCQIFAF